MPLQIVEFNDMTPLNTGIAQICRGAPIAVSAPDFTGLLTPDPKTKLVKISGSGTITWKGGQTPEAFDGVEFRGVEGITAFTVA